MNTPIFWEFFEIEAYPKLAARQNSMRCIFEYLDQKNRPVFVVETGCVRKENNWAGDGQSTILFDRFISQWPGSEMYSVDIDPNATDLCKSLVSSATKIYTGDSVIFLRNLARNPPKNFSNIDVLYLDSYDLDLSNPHPSALHHMKEFLAVSPLIGPETLVVVDDAPPGGMFRVFILSGDSISCIQQPPISGKGKYIADYAMAIGLQPVISGYQAGWIGF